MINGINASALSEFCNEIKQDPAEAPLKMGTSLDWINGTKMSANTTPMELGRHRIVRAFEIPVDEPKQLLGTCSGPNPQEYLLSALAGCMSAAYVMAASIQNIALESLRIEIDAELDLRGFLGIEPAAPVQLQRVRYRILVKSDADASRLEELHQLVRRRSPNFQTFAQPIDLHGELIREA